MPTAPLPACLEPRCPNRAVARGYCAAHKRTEAQRGYGRDWRATRAERRGTACVLCGSAVDLVTDHVRNGDPSEVQTLCRSCNTAKRNRERGAHGGEGSRRVADRAIGHPGAALHTYNRAMGPRP